MGKHIILRILQAIVVLFGLSILIFFIARIIPGDPARLILGPLATNEQIKELTEEMHLDKPFVVQYYYWLTSLLQGDLGKSLYTRRSITTDLKMFVPATLELMFFSFVISLIIGQVMGVFAGYFRDSWFDNLFRVFSYIGIATPAFAIAIFALIIFSYTLNIAPAIGRIGLWLDSPPQITGLFVIDSILTGQWRTAFEAFKHILLPAISLAIANIAQEGRITRSSIIDNLQKDYIIAHKVHGIPTRIIIFKYLLKPSLVPTVSIMGLDFACLLANAFLVETVFMWPGISRYGVTAMLNKDLNAIIAVVLFIGILYSLMNLIVDIVVSYLDPRIRLQRGGI
ncbi:MAG: D,D-dipeptide ABC transport system permease protein DdpB [Atribacteria bacterium 34_128]|nr:MAG: D,D-dipeptide ABC transport system permease protein DdpB [Atribacteria bacterium 34_128]HBY57722.1 peptide ABC transporter [Candidatus Atribacteria bacterium]